MAHHAHPLVVRCHRCSADAMGISQYGLWLVIHSCPRVTELGRIQGSVALGTGTRNALRIWLVDHQPAVG